MKQSFWKLAAAWAALTFYIPHAISAENLAVGRINAELGLAYLAEGYGIASKIALLKAVQEAPSLPVVWYAMGYYLEKTGDIAQAAHYYQIAIRVDKHSGEAKKNYGAFLCRQKNYHAGIQELLLAIQTPGYLDTAAAFENAGHCALKIPDTQLAAIYFRKALQNDPNLASAKVALRKISGRTIHAQ